MKEVSLLQPFKIRFSMLSEHGLQSARCGGARAGRNKFRAPLCPGCVLDESERGLQSARPGGARAGRNKFRAPLCPECVLDESERGLQSARPGGGICCMLFPPPFLSSYPSNRGAAFQPRALLDFRSACALRGAAWM